MVKSFVAFRTRRILERGQHGLEFHEQEGGVHHPALGASGMNAFAVRRHHGGSGVEVFILDFSQPSSVHRVGKIRAEACHVKVIRAAPYFLIRGEGDPDVSVGAFRMQQEGGGHVHDFRNARLVVRAKQGFPVRHHQVLAGIFLQFRKDGRGKHHAPLPVQHNVTPVIGMHDGRVYAAARHAGSRVHMRHPADGGNLFPDVGRDGGVHDAGSFIKLRLRPISRSSAASIRASTVWPGVDGTVPESGDDCVPTPAYLKKRSKTDIFIRKIKDCCKV